MLAILLLAPAVLGRMAGKEEPAQRDPRRLAPRLPAAATPYTENRVHRIGNLWLTVTNYGMIGSFDGSLVDQCTGRPAPALEFPGGSGTINLYVGALWIGAVRDRDTLVSVGNDGWQYSIYEMYPKPYPEGAIVERTSRDRLPSPPNSRCPDVLFSDSAISEQDIVAVYYDTVTSQQLVVADGTDGRPHIPLGLEVTQSSYAWAFDYAQDFVLLDYRIRNIGGRDLNDVYIGLFMDADAFHISNGGGWNDDISGFLRTVPSPAGHGLLDTVNTVWTADNDGDPRSGGFDFSAHTGVTGVRVLRGPNPDAYFSFNWWISNANLAFDWGPVRRSSKVQFPHSGLGTPNGDKAKYQVLSNGEFDYDQMEAAINHETDGWLPPLQNPLNAVNLANGFDTRYLLSTGPFQLDADSTLALAVAIVAGEDFHTDPNNFSVFFDAADPSAYRARLDFTDFALNSQWAEWVYDTPGYDTDGDGYRGEYRLVGEDTVYYRGDGLPDFKGPPPPPPPADLQFETFARKVVTRWNGKLSETAKDPFSAQADFEGYRVYLSRTGQLSDYALLAQRDLVNYTRYRWNPRTERWQTPDPPFSLDSLKRLYDRLTDSLYGYPFHPDSFPLPVLRRALAVRMFDPDDPARVDTVYYYFGPFDANQAPHDTTLAELAESGYEIVGVVRKVYPLAGPDDQALRDDGSTFWPYYEYEFALAGLQLAEPVFVAVTAFDHGNPGVGLAPLETSPLNTAQEVWPINSAAVVKSARPAPGVYPNPYRLADDYNLQGWEDPGRLGIDPERARRVTFTNVPDTCVVSIFSLDGDLVRRLDHREPPGSSQASVVVWDLITRNTQAVKSGIYIWTLESRFGTDIGKLVIIK
jgi:hypothetical protein